MPERYEHLLFRYSSALERGDFEVVADVLREAERDPALEAMLLELNEVYAAEQTGRSNHKNPKELAMIAPLYEKRAPERVRTYNLPMVAALAVVALLGVLLATRIAPPTQWNTAQNGSPEPNVLQGVPDECEWSGSAVPRLQLYSRPSTDARMIHEYVGLYVPQSALVQVDSAEAEGQSWYFVSISDGVAETQGWITADAYNQNVRCAPLVNAEILTRAVEEGKLTGTPTLAPFEERTVVATALPPTMVPPDVLAVVTATPVPFDGSMPTVVPADVQGLATFTATPVPFDGSMLPTISMPEAVIPVPTVVPVSFPEDYIVYTVEAGDTVLSILAHFGFDASMLDELLFINNLPNDVAELPETLLIPVRTREQWLTCLVDAGETIIVRQQPAADAREIVALPEGTVFRVFNQLEQANREWYMLVAQFGSVVIRSAWVDTEALSLNADCQRFFPISVAVMTTSAEQRVTAEAGELTATPMPTIVPFTATPTPAQ